MYYFVKGGKRFLASSEWNTLDVISGAYTGTNGSRYITIAYILEI